MSETKKWYNYFVSADSPGEAGKRAAGTPRSAAQTVAQIAANIPAEPKFTDVVSNPTAFDEIYRAAEIRPPAHGYTVMKVAQMLQSEHIRNLPAEVKRSSVLVALDAAGVKLQEIIEDAVRRDRALDTYERVQQKALDDLEAAKIAENRDVQAEMDRVVAQHRARIQANNDAVAKEKERLRSWRVHKQQEEERIAEALSYFTTEKLITTQGPTGPPSASPPARGA